jgi:ATP-dependent protease ClpP protease subunit
MARQVTGTLKAPDGTVLANQTILLVAITSTAPTVIKGAKSYFTSDGSGLYDLTVQNGFYRVAAESESGGDVALGKIYIQAGTAIDLPTLLALMEEPETPVNDALQALADAAAASAAEAAASAAEVVRRNSLINARLQINQRGVSGSVVLLAGEYGHDRMRAGASGCTYTFSVLNSTTTLDISAGTIQQEVEAQNVQVGPNVLSWVGTSQGRIGAGSFGDSGLVTDTLDGSSNVVCEWGVGTLSLLQLESGGNPTNFEYIPIGDELVLAHRYYERITYKGASRVIVGQATSSSATTGVLSYSLKRAEPTISDGGSIEATTAPAGLAGGTPSYLNISPTNSRMNITGASGLVAGNASGYRPSATTYIEIDAEL